MEQVYSFFDFFRQFWIQLSTFLPQLLASFLLLILGWLVAKLLRKGTIKLLKFLRFDDLAERSGIEDFLLQGGVRYTAVTILANLIYWFIVLTVFLAVLNSLGLQSATELFNKIILYIPQVIAAILILMFGTLFSKFIRGIVFTYLSNIGISGAELLSTATQWAILIFAISLSFEQLSIGGQILVSAFQIAFGALCLALALAFGLGGREWAAHLLDKMWKKP
ncbi:MAG TPA: hypothetical protein VFF29_01965 [Bacteroidota bacterium]|nr:hypothetical protein [Bacteroidota bacterium]